MFVDPNKLISFNASGKEDCKFSMMLCNIFQSNKRSSRQQALYFISRISVRKKTSNAFFGALSPKTFITWEN